MNPKILVIIIIVIGALVTFGLMKYLAKSGSYEYGAKINFQKNQIIKLPDFEIKYIGERSEQVLGFIGGDRKFTYKDFKVNPGNITVSWTAGTGDIGPEEFTVNGKKYILELAFSDKLGKLASNQLVISVVSQ